MNQPVAPVAPVNAPSYVKNCAAIEWVARIAALTKPARVYWCDGSQEEYDRLCNEMVESGMFKRLNAKLRPNCFLALSDPTDVARMEDRTFICSKLGRRVLHLLLRLEQIALQPADPGHVSSRDNDLTPREILPS